jgi:hypothetical protein
LLGGSLFSIVVEEWSGLLVSSVITALLSSVV